jgi:hypothetical protein
MAMNRAVDGVLLDQMERDRIFVVIKKLWEGCPRPVRKGRNL